LVVTLVIDRSRLAAALRLCCYARPKSSTNCFSATKIESDCRKSGSVAVLRSLIRILRASLAQNDTEMAEKYATFAEKYAKLGKAAKFRSVYDIRESNPVPAFGL